VKKISSLEYDIPDEFTDRAKHAVMVASHRRLTKNPAEWRDFKSSQCPKKT